MSQTTEPQKTRHDVVGIGNAIVDVLSHCEDAFLAENGIEKGVMQLIDTKRAAALYAAMGPATEISGGSAANTIAGLGALGLSTAYIGKVKDDQLGAIFAHDIRAQGVTYTTPLAPKTASDETGRSMILVTSDGERSMNTYLGVSESLGPDDIDTAQIAASHWVYLEGYRFDGAQSHAAFHKAITASKAAGGKVALTLSDPFCVERHREAFANMLRDHVDLLFCNEHELSAMYPARSLEESLAKAGAEVDLIACTIGAKGALAHHAGQTLHTPAAPARMVDATGAGDLFAAGFFYGLIRCNDFEKATRCGCAAAGEIISHIGARPEADLRRLLSEICA